MYNCISKLEDQSKVQLWARAQGTARSTSSGAAKLLLPSTWMGTGITCRCSPGCWGGRWCWEEGGSRAEAAALASSAGHCLQQGLMSLFSREGESPALVSEGISWAIGKGGWIVKPSQLWDGLSGKWRSPPWQDYLRLDFERRDTLQLGTMLPCQRDGLNYLIGRSVCLLHFPFQEHIFSWVISHGKTKHCERSQAFGRERLEEWQPGRCLLCSPWSRLLGT